MRDSVEAHYTRSDLVAAIEAGLAAADKDLNALGVDDLAAIDQFHTGGKQATQLLAQRAGITPGCRVLDVGGGLGGPARLLALEHGCEVCVLDLTAEFCRTGAWLTKLLDQIQPAARPLSERVTFRHGSALDMPFADESFDVVWSQHSSMNIKDKERLYRETHRVLRPGGTLAFQEIMAGAQAPIHLPVPWARQQATSFLAQPEALRALLARIGFKERLWLDESAFALSWSDQRLQSMAKGMPAVGVHLILGEDYPEMARNQSRNLREARVRVMQAVSEKARGPAELGQ